LLFYADPLQLNRVTKTASSQKLHGFDKKRKPAKQPRPAAEDNFRASADEALT